MYSEQINIASPTQKEQQQVFQILEQQPLVAHTFPVKLNDFYIVVSQIQADKQFQSQQQWDQILKQKFVERQSSMNLVALNSVLSIKSSQNERRNKIWSILIKQAETQNNTQQEQVDQDSKIVKQVQTNVNKLLKKIQMQDENKRDQLKLLLNHLISTYQAREPHLGAVKGLQYICYGIYLSLPNQYKQFKQLNLAFHYFMNILNFKQLFYHGSPLFYSQIGLLCEDLQSQAPKLYKFLQDNSADWPKIFIAYYRTLLINKLNNRKLILKIFDLILIYGISILRMILVKILSVNEDKLLAHKDPQQLMKVIGINLVHSQFQAQLLRQTSQITENQSYDEDQCIVQMFKKLIIGT